MTNGPDDDADWLIVLSRFIRVRSCRCQNADPSQRGTDVFQFVNIPPGLCSHSQMWNIHPPNRDGAKAMSGRSLIVGKSFSLGARSKLGSSGPGHFGL